MVAFLRRSLSLANPRISASPWLKAVYKWGLSPQVRSRTSSSCKIPVGVGRHRRDATQGESSSQQPGATLRKETPKEVPWLG